MMEKSRETSLKKILKGHSSEVDMSAISMHFEHIKVQTKDFYLPHLFSTTSREFYALYKNEQESKNRKQ